MTQTTVKTRRKFDATFKREAVNNWLARRKSAEVIAQELGISANRLYAWKQRFAPADAGGSAAGAKPGTPAELQAQLNAVLREVRHLREPRDIDRKSVAILSEPSPNAMNGSTR